MSAIAEVKDKIRFYVITIAEENPNSQLVEIQMQYQAEDLPKLIIEETFDAMNEILKVET